MWFGIFTLFTALTISVIAAWYSIIGLTAIFAAAFLPIVLMGGSLEVGKVVTAVWLHQNWQRANNLMRSYLITATVVLMLVTSMGIFGFLSKAHIEQTAASEENVAKIEQYTNEATRQGQIIERSTIKIDSLESAGASTDTKFQAQIDQEQIRIDSAYERIQPALAEQNVIIADQTKLYQEQLDKVKANLILYERYIDEGEIKKAQSLIGTKPDGSWKGLTVIAAEKWVGKQEKELARLIAKIEDVSQNNSAILAARAEITRLRQSAESQIAQSNTLINRLRSKIGTTETTNVEALVDEHYAKITNANAEIERLTTARYELEGEYRKLEAEVGPIKYIAEFVYGQEADRELLEEAVKWVIIMLIFVFDPLAICLILAGAQQIQWSMKTKPKEQAVTLGPAPGVPPVNDVVLDSPDVPFTVVDDAEVSEFVLDDTKEEYPSFDSFTDEETHEEPEPTIETIEEPTQSIVDSMEKLEPKAETEQQKNTRLKKALQQNNQEREQLIEATKKEDRLPQLEPIKQKSEIKTTDVLPPIKVADFNSVAGTGKPFEKKHK